MPLPNLVTELVTFSFPGAIQLISIIDPETKKHSVTCEHAMTFVEALL